MVVAFCAGEVLIGFELLHSKFRAGLPAIQMWPVSEEAWQLWNPTVDRTTWAHDVQWFLQRLSDGCGQLIDLFSDDLVGDVSKLGHPNQSRHRFPM